MEPACSLKRERPNEYSLCIICQETKKENLCSTHTGLSTLINAANFQRSKQQNSKTYYHLLIEKLTVLSNDTKRTTAPLQTSLT